MIANLLGEPIPDVAEVEGPKIEEVKEEEADEEEKSEPRDLIKNPN